MGSLSNDKTGEIAGCENNRDHKADPSDSVRSGGGAASAGYGIALSKASAYKKQEGISVVVETIQPLKGIEGVLGSSIMAIEWEKAAHEIAQRANFWTQQI